MTSEEQFDDEGFAVPGTYPLSVVSLGMWGAGGKPMPSVESAVCDTCGDWAATVHTSGESKGHGGDLMDVRTSRRVVEIVYACPQHYGDVMNALVEKYGHASNRYDPDDLAIEVNRQDRMR